MRKHSGLKITSGTCVFAEESGLPPVMLRYEDKPQISPEYPVDSDCGEYNQAGCGVNPIIAWMDFRSIQAGTVYFPLCKIPAPENKYDPGIVLMYKKYGDTDWRHSNVIFIEHKLSMTGLLNPVISLLNNGVILLICQGMGTSKTSGKYFYCVSEDGGKNLSYPEELRYHDGSILPPFLSGHCFLRNRGNEKTYWLTSISGKTDVRNCCDSKYFLMEIDEEKPVVIKKQKMNIDLQMLNNRKTWIIY